jgi:soluble lytic murein transglycosylase-like protein
MKEIIIIGIGLAWWYSVKKNRIPQSWITPNEDSYLITPVGVLPFESDIMKFKEIIMREGERNKIEGAIIASIIAKESKGIPSVTNGRFLGLMQFGVSEAQAMGFKGASSELLKPDVNIKWGSKYLAYCISKKGGDLYKGISGYNTGQVERPDTPYNAEYVNQIATYTPRFRFLLTQSYLGYSNVFPKDTWLKTDTVYA